MAMTAVGEDIESVCGKCGDVWHVVVAMVETDIAKVECKECKATHKYKPTGEAKKKADEEKKAAKKKTTKKKTTRKPRKSAEPALPEGPRAEANDKPPQKYSIKGSFEIGDRVEHPSFGEGVVDGLPAPGKIEVYFTDGRKTLAAAKPESKLEAGGRAAPIIGDGSNTGSSVM